MTTTNLPPASDPDEKFARADQEARRARKVVSLFDRHAELRGINALADLLDESVRWTA
jgi:hypothetical protein